MENINTLLVAFMFITILTLGIASILGELAEVVRNVDRRDRDHLLIGWALLLLFAYFALFWHTADITLLEDWDFWLFLFAETGPVLLLFATQIMLGALAAEPAGPETSTRQERFFIIFALLQLWSIAAGFLLGVGLTPEAAFDAVIFVTCVALAFSKNRALHVAGLAIVWVAYLASALYETLA
jgi:predicted membrane protein